MTLAFGGDVHFEGVIRSRLTSNPATAVGPIASMLRRADLAMVNLETAITTRGTPQSKSFTFRAPASAFQALKAAGVDVATMANVPALPRHRQRPAHRDHRCDPGAGR